MYMVQHFISALRVLRNRLLRSYHSIRVTIHVSILTVVLTIVLGISLVILCLGARISYDSAIRLAQQTITSRVDQVTEHIVHYFSPIEKLLVMTQYLVGNHGLLALQPDERLTDRQKLMDYLQAILKSNSNISGAYFTTSRNSFYIVNRLEGGDYYQMAVVRDATGKVRSARQNWISQQDDILAQDIPVQEISDITRKTWYKNALRYAAEDLCCPRIEPADQPGHNDSGSGDGNNSTKQDRDQRDQKVGAHWVMYEFSNFGRSGMDKYGITAIQNFYTPRLPGQLGAELAGTQELGGQCADQLLRGILCLDILSGAVNDFLASLALPNGSIAFIYDSTSQQIIWHHLFGNDRLSREELGQIPAVQVFMGLDKQLDGREVLHFNDYNSLHKSSWMAATCRIPNVYEQHWVAAVMIPVSVLTQDIKTAFITLLTLTFVATGIGIICSLKFADSMSSSIKKLVMDAKNMCVLRCNEVFYRPSFIEELYDISRAFINLRNALLSFMSYMPTDVVRQLVDSGTIAQVGGKKKLVTVLFSDVRDFTKISEGLAPEVLMKYLSSYFQVVSKAILNVHGTIDKYIGDSVMAFWGAPTDDQQQAIHACQAILEVQKAVRGMYKLWQAQDKPLIVTRFGVNTGYAVVGNVGSQERLNYTVIGDTVNLASRLEGINKIYGTTVAVGEATYRLAREYFRFRIIDCIIVKGKTRATYFYELLDEAHWLWENWKLYNQQFKPAFVKYQRGQWSSALAQFQQLATQYPQDSLAPVFVSRCQQFMQQPPVDWQGVWKFTTK